MWKLAISCLLVAMAPAFAVAQVSCPVRHRVTFADGGTACLGDHPIGQLRPLGHDSPLLSLVPGHGYYQLSIPYQPRQCAHAATLYLPPVAANFNPASNTGGYFRSGAIRSKGDCESTAGKAKLGSPCDCVVLLSNGTSTIPRADFDRIARDALATAGIVEQASSSDPLAGNQMSGTTSAGTDVNALRLQVETLQRQVAQQRPEAAPPRLRARAIVIGNGAYSSLSRLPNPRRDAEAIAAKLRQFGIESDLVLDADRAALVRALSDYQTRAAQYDLNILFYAGHGLQVGGVNYILPIDLDAPSATVGSIKLTAVSVNDALEYLPAPTRVVFLDACRDNPVARSLVSTRAAVGIGLAPIATVSGTLVAYATKDGSTAEDGTGQNSPYTAALLQHLDSEEDIAIVLRRVRQAVLAATGNRQEPWEYGSLTGERIVLSRTSR